MAAAGGATFGVTNDGVYNIDASVPTIVDLLEAKGVSWSIYQEDMPYSGFTGDYKNAQGQNDYVRKHKYVFLFWPSFLFFPFRIIISSSPLS